MLKQRTDVQCNRTMTGKTYTVRTEQVWSSLVINERASAEQYKQVSDQHHRHAAELWADRRSDQMRTGAPHKVLNVMLTQG